MAAKVNLRLNPDKIPDLGWKWCERLSTTSVGRAVEINCIENESNTNKNVNVNTIYIGTVIKSQAQLDSTCNIVSSSVKLPIVSIEHQYLCLVTVVGYRPHRR